MSALCWTYRQPIFIRGINLEFSCSPFLPVVSGNDGKTEWGSLFIHYYRTGLTRVKVYSSWHVWQNAPVNPYSPKFQSIKLFMHVCVHMCVMCLHVCTRVHMHLKAKGSLISGLFPGHLPPYSLSRVSKWNRELSDPPGLACWLAKGSPVSAFWVLETQQSTTLTGRFPECRDLNSDLYTGTTNALFAWLFPALDFILLDL